MRQSIVMLLGLVVMSAGCLHASEPIVPAVLVDGSERVRDTLKELLTQAVSKADHQLRSTDLTQSSTLTLIPPPLGPNETHSLSRPIQFKLTLEGEACYAVRSDTGTKIMLVGITCRAA